MKVAISLVYRDEKDAEKLASLEKLGVGVLVELPGNVLKELGVDEITDPLIEYKVRFPIVSVAFGREVDLAEKAVIIAEELGSEYVTVTLGAERLSYFASITKDLFRIFSCYKVGLCIGAEESYVGKLKEIILSNIGGVFWLTISPGHTMETGRLIRLIEENLRVVRIIRAVNYADKAIRPLFKGKSINYYKVLKKLLEVGYQGYFVLDYEPKGLPLKVGELSRELELIGQVISSLHALRRRSSR